MSDVMSVRLHLSAVRVLGVLVDSVDRLEVEVESTPSGGHQHTNRTCSEPGTRSYAEMTISQKPTESTWIGSSMLIPACVPPGTRSRSLCRIYEADDLDGANEALARFADLYATGQIPEYHKIVDTIIAWGEEILAYHASRRTSNGPLEGINNLLQVLRRVAHGFTNYGNYAARGLLVT